LKFDQKKIKILISFIEGSWAEPGEQIPTKYQTQQVKTILKDSTKALFQNIGEIYKKGLSATLRELWSLSKNRK
jgi:hypothetical protein